jgi:hypothetical protein
MTFPLDMQTRQDLQLIIRAAEALDKLRGIYQQPNLQAQQGFAQGMSLQAQQQNQMASHNNQICSGANAIMNKAAQEE